MRLQHHASKKSRLTACDIIGDIRGYAAPLESLLRRLLRQGSEGGEAALLRRARDGRVQGLSGRSECERSVDGMECTPEGLFLKAPCGRRVATLYKFAKRTAL